MVIEEATKAEKREASEHTDADEMGDMERGDAVCARFRKRGRPPPLLPLLSDRLPLWLWLWLWLLR